MPFRPTARRYNDFGLPHFVDERGIQYLRLRDGRFEDREYVQLCLEDGALDNRTELFDFRIPRTLTKGRVRVPPPQPGDVVSLFPLDALDSPERRAVGRGEVLGCFLMTSTQRNAPRNGTRSVGRISMRIEWMS